MSTTAPCAVRTFTCAEYLRHRGYLVDDRPVPTPCRRLLIHDIQEAVCRHFKVWMEDMESSDRRREVARPRQVAMYLCHYLTDQSLADIGRRFGNRDHTTVLHAIRQVTKLRAENREIDHAVRALWRQLEEKSHA